jgi:pimeloyl-ACP methyl ester carboxylesterase
MGVEAQTQPIDSPGHNTNNTKIVPLIFVPGVMGTRLNFPGTAFNWDPNDDGEMSGWVLNPSRRELVRRVNAADTSGTPARDLDENTNPAQANVDPRGDINKRSRLKQLATDKLPKGTNSRAFPGQIVKFYKDRGWGEVVWSFYGNLLMELAETLNPGSHGGELHPVHVFGYDWRQSNADSGRRLKDRIKAVLKLHPAAQQVILLTHSMGGLVARAALQQGAEPDILGVIHTVIPADGAVVAYRRFFTGASNAAEGNEDPLNTILGPTRLDYGLMQSVLRGPVELLPHNSYPEVFFRMAGGTVSRDIPDLFSVYANNPAPPGIVFTEGEEFDAGFFSAEIEITAEDVTNLREAIRSAGRFTDGIRGRFHPKTYLVFGDGVQTDMEVDFAKASLTPTGAGAEAIGVKKAQGDGTVPAPSAQFRAVSSPRGRVPVTGAVHAQCFDAPGFNTIVIDNIRELLTKP